MANDKQQNKGVKNKGGRPLKPIDTEQVRKLASIHCTSIEIASFVGCSVDTLERRFADVIHDGKETGKSSLRRLQWHNAEKGNVHMQIWLGKQWLGQRDKQPDEVASTVINVQVIEVPK